jgi:hypothetical protein
MQSFAEEHHVPDVTCVPTLASGCGLRNFYERMRLRPAGTEEAQIGDSE